MTVEIDGLELTGYFPGVAGKIIEEHAIYYNENWGFDISFETQVGKELSEFLMRFQKSRDGFWAATMSGEFAGSIAIDGSQENKQDSRLRWFIVDSRFQNRSIGKVLLRESIEFCRKAGHKRVYLWTFKGLDAARCLYEQEGFKLCETREARQWGKDIIEQMFELYL
ncbi:MAG TPA: GNAT family N-acetyltransferase [Desulfatiglandales bacterium]|nr:GNAT family N-acetyltransferase [Desulfatiglandales bacterium]